MREPWIESVRCLESRRNFILAGGSLAVLPWMHQIALSAPIAKPSFKTDPFQLGVASGDPSSDGVVLWTRLATAPFEPKGGMPQEDYEVVWEIADDESMKNIVSSGKTLATHALGHSVHVEVSGLQPDRWYWYRFQCGDAVTKVARTRTVPAQETMPDRLRFAFASCQHFETGLYTAYQHMCQEELDLIVHLGDYIYEGKGLANRTRQHIGNELHTLDEYRGRYAQYKTDPHLQQAHQLAPWLVVWDDHEFDNNCAGLISEEAHVTREEYALRRANAYQAYYENMPLRATSMPQGHDMLLYRRIHYGRLAQFDMLDTRQYRTDQPNGDGRKDLVGDVFNPNATMLGDAQEKWLMEGLAQSSSRWNILAQQVMMGRTDRIAGPGRGFPMDQWNGYHVPRTRLLQGIRDLKKNGAVVLTGDVHNHWANELFVDFDNLKEPVVATELVGTSISSGGNGTAKPEYLGSLLEENPFVKFHNNERGYVSCTVTPAEWTAEYQTVPYVDRPDAPKFTRAKFHIQPDRPGLHSA